MHDDTTASTSATSPAASPRKVMLWSPWGSGNWYHGPGSFAFRMYGAAPADWFDVHLVHGKKDQPSCDVYPKSTLVHPYTGKVANTFGFLRASKRWIRQHAREADVFHALSGYHISVVPAYEAQKQGTPAVIFIANHRHEMTEKGGVKKLLGWAKQRREMAANVSAVIAMSQAIHDELREYNIPEENIARIPMGVNTQRFSPASDQVRKAIREQFQFGDEPVLVFSGGINARKRPHLLIEAIDFARDAGFDCTLALAGPVQDEQYAAGMRQRIDALNLGERVRWLGFVQDIAAVYQAANVFSLPSEREGMPAAVVEAMSCALPCMVTNISGCGDLIDDGACGRIIEPTRESAGQALLDYLKDSATAQSHGQAARRRVLASYSTDAVAAAYRRLFDIIVAGGSAADASIVH